MKALSNFNRFVLAHATGRTILLMLGITIASFWLMAFVIAPAFQETTNGLRPFDLNFGITAETMYQHLPVYTERTRTLYVWFAIADFVYPAAAAAFFSLLWARLFGTTPNRIHVRLTAAGILVVPFLFALADWAENVGFLFVIFSYPAEHPAIGDLAGTLKKIKPFIEALIVLLTLIFAVAALGRGALGRWGTGRR